MIFAQSYKNLSYLQKKKENFFLLSLKSATYRV